MAVAGHPLGGNLASHFAIYLTSMGSMALLRYANLTDGFSNEYLNRKHEGIERMQAHSTIHGVYRLLNCGEVYVKAEGQKLCNRAQIGQYCVDGDFVAHGRWKNRAAPGSLES